jgi:hypothetical protein
MPTEEPVSPQPNEPLASKMGDPAGSPQAVEAKDPVLRGIATLGITAVIAGGILVPFFASAGSCMGATRSAKVKWEQRQQQIEKAEAAHERQLHE